MTGLYLRALHAAHLLRRPMTLGVRALAFDAHGRVFLVRHTYVAGWYLPGGGVEAGETGEAALGRELEEEGRLEWDGRPRLLSVHLNEAASRRDHVFLYRVDGARQSATRKGDIEIAEARFFDPEALPEGTTEATLRRIAEAREGRKPDPYW